MPSYLSSPTCWALVLGPLAITACFTPIISKMARRIGAIDHGGYRKINSRSIPRLGGLAIAFSVLLICFLGIFHPTSLLALVADREKDFLILLVGGGAIAALGIFDDIHGLGPRLKFGCQIFVALLVVLAGKGIQSVYLPVMGLVEFNPITGALLTVLWIVGVINAFNLVDGLDGLATGLALIATLGLGVISAINGQTFTVILCLGLAGSLGGFLIFNFNPARIFLGDTGSLFIGFMLAMLSLLGGSKATGSVMLAPILVLGFPIFDTLTSMARRILRGRSPFVGDRAHTHHRLLDYGYSHRQAVLILYGVAFLCTVSAILFQVFYPNAIKSLLACSMYLFVIGVVAWANGYLRLRHIKRILLCRNRNSKLSSFSHYAALALKRKVSTLTLYEVLRLGCKELNLKYLEISQDDCLDAIAGYYTEDYGGSDEAAGVRQEVKVTTTEGQLLTIHYELQNAWDTCSDSEEDIVESTKLERQDIMACLASLFHGVSLKGLLEESYATALQNEELRGKVVQNMSDVVGNISYVLAKPALSLDGE